MKRKLIRNVFISLAVLFSVLTILQFFSMSSFKTHRISEMKPMSYKTEKYTKETRTREDLAREYQEERERIAKEQREMESAERKDRIEMMKLYFGFGTSIFTSLVSIILAIINRKK